MGTYVVATKREARADGVSTEQRLRNVPGVEVKGAGTSNRLLIEMSSEVASEVQQRFGEQLLVEPVIMHDKLSGDTG